jgi:hypothetical protein
VENEDESVMVAASTVEGVASGWVAMGRVGGVGVAGEGTR